MNNPSTRMRTRWTAKRRIIANSRGKGQNPLGLSIWEKRENSPLYSKGKSHRTLLVNKEHPSK